ncbi:MAG: HU family DNA-binding protein [Gaiellaceae bacterium]
MNKGEFAEALAERTELSKAAANRALEAILDTLTEAMVERDEVSFSGWGKFSAQRRKGRDAHDPRNPQRTIRVAPAYVPKFKAGSVLKREIAALVAEEQPDAATSGRAAPARAEAPTPAEADGDARSAAESRDGNNGNDRQPGGWRPLAHRQR